MGSQIAPLLAGLLALSWMALLWRKAGRLRAIAGTLDPGVRGFKFQDGSETYCWIPRLSPGCRLRLTSRASLLTIELRPHAHEALHAPFDAKTDDPESARGFLESPTRVDAAQALFALKVRRILFSPRGIELAWRRTPSLVETREALALLPTLFEGLPHATPLGPPPASNAFFRAPHFATLAVAVLATIVFWHRFDFAHSLPLWMKLEQLVVTAALVLMATILLLVVKSRGPLPLPRVAWLIVATTSVWLLTVPATYTLSHWQDAAIVEQANAESAREGIATRPHSAKKRPHRHGER